MRFSMTSQNNSQDNNKKNSKTNKIDADKLEAARKSIANTGKRAPVQIMALGAVALFLGSAFGAPAANAAAPEIPDVRSAIVTPASTSAVDLTRVAEQNILKDALGIDPGSVVIGHVSEDGKIITSKAQDPAGKSSIYRKGWTAPLKKFGFSATYGQAGGWSSGHHTGLDFTAPVGSKVMAAHGGKVIEAQQEGAYGNIIKIRDKDGVETWYAHLSKIDVSKGDTVKAGDVIGAVGMTGNTTGPHLHFEVRTGPEQHVDPAKYIWKNHKLPKVSKTA